MASRDDPEAPRRTEPSLPSVRERMTAVTRGADVQGADLTGIRGDVDAAHSHIVESLWDAPDVGTLDLTGGAMTDVRVSHLRATQVRARDARWRDVSVEGGRVGSLDLLRAELDGVVFRGVRIDYLGLAAASLRHVRFVDCTFGALDLPEARADRIAFEHCRADEVDARGLRAVHADLRGLDALAFTDISGLRGVTLSPDQAMQHGVAFATALGVRVRD
jgi:uncharacterized protein YjbI with pentapeptide repeats